MCLMKSWTCACDENCGRHHAHQQQVRSSRVCLSHEGEASHWRPVEVLSRVRAAAASHLCLLVHATALALEADSLQGRLYHRSTPSSSFFCDRHSGTTRQRPVGLWVGSASALRAHGARVREHAHRGCKPKATAPQQQAMHKTTLPASCFTQRRQRTTRSGAEPCGTDTHSQCSHENDVAEPGRAKMCLRAIQKFKHATIGKSPGGNDCSDHNSSHPRPRRPVFALRLRPNLQLDGLSEDRQLRRQEDTARRQQLLVRMPHCWDDALSKAPEVHDL